MKNSGILEKLNGKKLIIFGAGIAGVGVLKLLRHYGLKAEGFFDNKAENSYTKEDLTVAKFDLSTFDPKETLFIVAIHNVDEAIGQLKCFNLDSVLGYDLIDDDNKKVLSFQEYQKLEGAYFYYERIYNKNGINIDSLDMVITEYCSLKCKECSNLMQFYEAPEHLELEDLKNTLERLTNIVDEIYEIRLIGGEPFVYPHFEDILNYVASNEKIKRISIYTNGTILPKDSALNAIKSSGAWLSISDYGALSKKLTPLRETLDAMNIPYEVKFIDYWTKCADFTKHNRSFEETKKVYASCCARTLITLLRGKVYVCPFIANAMNLKAIPNNNEDYIDLLSTETNEELRRKLIKFMGRQGFASCDYCNGRPIPLNVEEKDKIPPYEQITTAREYKKYE